MELDPSTMYEYVNGWFMPKLEDYLKQVIFFKRVQGVLKPTTRLWNDGSWRWDGFEKLHWSSLR